MIDQLLRYFIPDFDQHLSDNRLASLFCDELTFTEKLIAKRHLRGCRECCQRKDDLEGPRADLVFNLYREALESEERELSTEPQAEFERRLEFHLQQLPRRQRILRIPKISLGQLLPMNLSLAVFGVLAFATACSFLFWWQHRVPNITSNTLLVRAESWDAAYLATASARGVMYQSVRIIAPKVTMERSIYRDLQGKRKVRPIRLEEDQERLRATLMHAGVDWDAPISASDYQAWHDHQRIRADHIVRSGKHLLRLTTVVPNSPVSSESLTVRDSDFHPVRRTVDIRDVGTIEIAELDFKILPWSAVNPDIFEPMGDLTSRRNIESARVLQFPKLPEMVTQDQLDASELDARLVLNQLHADTDEQIELHRNQQEIEVEGVVETDERKRQLQMQLSLVPHVVTSIQSAADLRKNPAPAGETATVETASMPDRPSPLETYLERRGQSTSGINAFAQRLFSAALTISQESKAIVDLQTRFTPDEQRTVLEEATLSELIYSHRERLQAALKTERELLGLTAIVPVPQPSGSGTGAPLSLMDAAGRNLSLSKELTQTNSPAMRSAEQILADMSVSIGGLAAAADDSYGKSQDDSTLSRKK